MSNWLVTSMQNLGYEANNNGVCYGVAYMGIQAFLADDLDTFNERLALIKKLDLEYTSKKQFQTYLDDIRNQPEKIVDEDIGAEDLSTIEEIPAFFDGIELYQQAHHHADFFELDKIPKHQNALVAVPLLLSKKLETDGGIAHIDRFVGAYEKQDLIDYFRSLQETFDANPDIKDPIIFNINNFNHAIAVGYDPVSREWTYINANALPARQILQVEKIATRVLSAFSKNNVAVLSTEIFGKKTSEENIKLITQQWMKTEKWKKANRVEVGEKIDRKKPLLDIKKKEMKKDSNGVCLLHLAAKEGYPSVVNEILLENSNLINETTDNRMTALHFAVDQGQLDIIDLLLKYNPKVNIINKDNAIPLHYAVRDNLYDVVDKLLDLNSLSNLISKEGTVLNIAAKRGHVDIVKLLLQKSGIRVQGLFNSYEPALFTAVQNGHLEIVNLLIENGAIINEIYDGMTPLYLAAHYGHYDIAETLINNNAAEKIDFKVFGITSLMIASANGHLDIVKLLLKWGADINATTSEGKSALYLAAQNGHADVVKFLLEKQGQCHVPCDDNTTPLFAAAANGHVNVVNCLLPYSPNLNVTGAEGLTPLMVAANRGHVEVVEALLAQGADTTYVNTKFNEYFGQNALQIAVEKGQAAIVKCLLEHHVDPNVVVRTTTTLTSIGAFPLYTAAEKGDLSIVKLLLQHGADVNMAGYEGKTPLFVAAENGHKDIVLALLEKNPNINKKTTQHHTALTIAEQGRRSEIAGILAKYKLQQYLIQKKVPLDNSHSKIGFFQNKEVKMAQNLLGVLEGKKPFESLQKYDKELKASEFHTIYTHLKRIC